MRVWLDFSNSPHPLLFTPIVRRLEAAGHQTVITVRDNAQTVELSRQRFDQICVVGGESPGRRAAKAVAIGQRIAELARFASRNKIDVALSHNSYAQIVASTLLRIPAVTAMDFEHQPSNHIAFRLATRVLVPSVIPASPLHRQGATRRKLVRYPGLKEELYIGDFRPDYSALELAGLSERPRVLVLARTPPSRAIYHASTNPLFDAALREICGQSGVGVIVLARHSEQRAAINAMGLQNCLVPARAVDSRSLMYGADLMIGAGGTMTREAALMGIPTWTLFSGARPAADEWLMAHGCLRRLAEPSQLAHLEPRAQAARTPEQLRAGAEAIESVFVSAVEDSARRLR